MYGTKELHIKALVSNRFASFASVAIKQPFMIFGNWNNSSLLFFFSFIPLLLLLWWWWLKTEYLGRFVVQRSAENLPGVWDNKEGIGKDLS